MKKHSLYIFVIPFILFISDYITKKYGFKETLYGILVSSLIIVTFLVLIKDLTNQKVIVLDLAYNSASEAWNTGVLTNVKFELLRKGR